ncbi:hypothetical protein P9112_009669 [Eukaryota sp. TZLM1-RC]
MLKRLFLQFLRLPLLCCSLLFTYSHPFYFFWASVISADTKLFPTLSTPSNLLSTLSIFILFRYLLFFTISKRIHQSKVSHKETLPHFLHSHVPCLLYTPLVVSVLFRSIPESFIVFSSLANFFISPIVFYLSSRFYFKKKLVLPTLSSLLLLFILLIIANSPEKLLLIDKYSYLLIFPLAGGLKWVGRFFVLIFPLIMNLLFFPLFYSSRPAIREFNKLIKQDVKFN